MIELEILQMTYWEHFKAESDMARYLPVEHPKRVKLRTEFNNISERIQKLQENGNS